MRHLTYPRRVRLVVPTVLCSLALLVLVLGAVQARNGQATAGPLILMGLLSLVAAALLAVTLRQHEKASGASSSHRPESHAIYRIPVGAVLSFWTGSLLTTLMFGAMIAYLISHHAFIQAGVATLAWAMLFVVVMLPSLTIVRRADVTPAGLITTTTLGFRRSVAWEDVASLREREPNRLYRSYALLELLDRGGTVRARLNSRLENYSQLRTSIERHVSRDGRPSSSSDF